jgi:signal peptidase II
MSFLFPICIGLILLDQASKLAVLHYFPVYSGKTIIPGLFNLVHVRNTGASFSLLAGADASWRLPFFITTTLLIVGVILFAYSKVRRDDYWAKTAYSFIVGGALGNLIDRLRFGEVIDFLDFYIKSYHWPAFNVADSAITTGAVMLLVSILRPRQA